MSAYPDGASGPTCYRRALALAREAADIRGALDDYGDDSWAPGGRDEALRTADHLIAEAAVYAQLANAAAVIDGAIKQGPMPTEWAKALR